MEKKQAFNPYLPNYEYIPDAEPRVFGGRVYIYGSHDKFNGISFCLLDYVCWSAPVGDLADWRYEGVIWRKSQDPGRNKGFLKSMYAPDVVRGPDGKYYLYYFIAYNGYIAVAVCDTPAGKYEYLGKVKYADGMELGKKGEPLQFDPGIFVNGDGRVFLYTGFGPVRYPKFLMGRHRATEKGAMCFELESDMLTVKGGLNYIGVPAKPMASGTGYEGHEFFEASSLRKFNGKYYFIYSSFAGHELCYALSDSPTGPYRYAGALVSIGDIGVGRHTSPINASNFTGNIHGSIAEIGGKYYVFYHRQTNRHQFSRQACAEEIFMRPDGCFDQAERTCCGLNGGPLAGKGEYPAAIACCLYGKRGARFYGVLKGIRRNEPYLTQTGKDRESKPDQYIANVCDGTVIGFKYFEFKGTKTVSVFVKGSARGKMTVSRTENGVPVADILIAPGKTYGRHLSPIKIADGKSALFFKFSGSGRLDFKSFLLE
ncbi:MAG: family 43 glycosylhydrolase [Clostridiales bacterium]|nr:family 43 glycosylhydrolase [Clostridiales bacterium]